MTIIRGPGGRARGAPLACGLLMLLGCGSPSVPPAGDTARMADTLAALYARAVAAPRDYPFLNRIRADSIEAVLATQDGMQAVNTRFALAQERLYAGQTRAAIAELERVLREAGAALDERNPANKPFYDLLAIAWLRLGEQDNCLLNPGAGVCILPLDGAARHTLEEGARNAVMRYEALLRRHPDDHASQWLLNVAYMALGGYPRQVPRQWLVPGLDRTVSPVFPRFPNVAGEVGLAVDGLAGGLSVADFDRDGHLDLFMTSWGFNDQAQLFMADGRGGYLDRTEAAGLAGVVGGLNTVHADYDNDGFDDVLILRGAWLGDAGAHPNSLLRNRGDGTFEDVTFAAGVLSFHPTQTAAWADFNLDGHLDLFIGNESMARLGGRSHPSELYLNNGDGTFTEVARRVGLVLDEFVKGVVWGDVNDNGLPDLFVSVMGGPNRLYLNRGGRSIADWRFEEVGDAAGVRRPNASFAAWFWDFDQDGHEDLLVLSYDNRQGGLLADLVAREYLDLPLMAPEAGRPAALEPTRLFRNRGDGTFEDVTHPAGLAGKAIFAMGANFGDLDNDGWLDFYLGTGNPDLRSVIPNRMFRNVDGRRFEEVTLPGGFGHIQKGHAIAFADLNRSGFQDIYAVMGGAYEGDGFANVLFANPGWEGRSWVTLELEGRSANRSAIGARVAIETVQADGTRRTLHRTVGTGGSFGAGSLQLHVGLDRAERIERLTIRWPDRERSTTSHPGLTINHAYRVVQGQEPKALERPPVPFRTGGPVVPHQH